MPAHIHPISHNITFSPTPHSHLHTLPLSPSFFPCSQSPSLPPNPNLHRPKRPQKRRAQKEILKTDTHPCARHLFSQEPAAVIAVARGCGDEEDPEEYTGDGGPVGEGDEGDVLVESLGRAGLLVLDLFF